MDRPRPFLVPQWTDVEWTIRPLESMWNLIESEHEPIGDFARTLREFCEEVVGS